MRQDITIYLRQVSNLWSSQLCNLMLESWACVISTAAKIDSMKMFCLLLFTQGLELQPLTQKPNKSLLVKKSTFKHFLS